MLVVDGHKIIYTGIDAHGYVYTRCRRTYGWVARKAWGGQGQVRFY